jgi:hypothetical protein
MQNRHAVPKKFPTPTKTKKSKQKVSRKMI